MKDLNILRGVNSKEDVQDRNSWQSLVMIVNLLKCINMLVKEENNDLNVLDL